MFDCVFLSIHFNALEFLCVLIGFLVAERTEQGGIIKEIWVESLNFMQWRGYVVSVLVNLYLGLGDLSWFNIHLMFQ